jgi:cytochrome b6-f complex iron-sulfur subunit
MSEAPITRRDFLKLARAALLWVGSLLGLGALLRFLGYRSQPSAPTEFDLGPAAAYPPGTRVILPQVPALLIHDETGFSALSLTCTHLGCTVEPTAQGFTCPCHGSRFAAAGSVLKGPASRSLPALRLELTAPGNLLLHAAE